MARARHVYVVVNTAELFPVAGFTVKHEMVGWLGRSEQRPKLARLTVIRLPDGGYGDPVEMPIDELLASDD